MRGFCFQNIKNNLYTARHLSNLIDDNTRYDDNMHTFFTEEYIHEIRRYGPQTSSYNTWFSL